MRLLLALLLTANALAQPLDTKAVDKLMTSTMKAWQVPGAAIAIVQNDKVIYAQGYGDGITPDTLFQIASTSKAFTSAAMAMLVDDKKVDWDDPVREHLEYFHLSDACADASVTIRDILSHRTGLSRHDELWDNSSWSREEVVRRIGSVELSKPFRSAYQYQNIMFIAAGEVVTHASGMTWDDFVRTRIFQPLQMTHTVTSDADWNASQHATSYRYDFKSNTISPQKIYDTTTIGSGGAIKSSARDMANWIRFQLADGVFDGKRLVSAAALSETKTPQTVIRLEGLTGEVNPETSLINYAMGWNVQDYRGEQLIAHAGALNGFRTHVDLLPKKKTGFVLLINAGRGISLYALRNTLIDMLTGKPARDWNAYYLDVDHRADEKEAKEKDERLAKRVPNTTPSHPLAEYAGTYENRAYGTAKVSLVNGALVLQWSKLTLPLTHFHYDVFRAQSQDDDVDEEVLFSGDAEGKVKTLTFYGERFERPSS